MNKVCDSKGKVTAIEVTPEERKKVWWTCFNGLNKGYEVYGRGDDSVDSLMVVSGNSTLAKPQVFCHLLLKKDCFDNAQDARRSLVVKMVSEATKLMNRAAEVNIEIAKDGEESD